MEALTYYVEIAKKEAQMDGVMHRDDTYSFVKQMFDWRHPERSTYNKEAVCIVLIRANPEKGERPRQVWIPTYKSRLCNGERIYLDNFDYITSLIKVLTTYQQEGQYNLFMAYGTFRYEDGYNRTQAKAFKIKSVGIDLDFNKLPEFQGKSYEESISKVKQLHSEVFAKYTPMIIRSGGGCQLYFLLNKPIMLYDSKEGVASEQGLKRFRKLSAYFNQEFSDCGSDSHCKGDTARIFRVPGTLSLKYDSPRSVCLEAVGRSHGYKAILSLPDDKAATKAPKSPQKPSGSKRTLKEWSGQTTPFDIKSQYGLRGYTNIVERRIEDLKTAVTQCQGNIEGYRNQTIFVAAAILYAGCRDYSQLLTDLQALNETFSPPLSDAAVEEVLRNVIDKDIKVTNTYIYETLYKPWGIDLEKLYGLYTQEARQENDRKRKPKKKAYSKEEKLAFIRAHADMKNADIASELHCGIRTIQLLRKVA